MNRHQLLGEHPLIFWTIVIAGGFLGLTILVSLFAISVYAYYEFGQWIAPGTNIGQIDIGGMTAIEAEHFLDQSWSQSDFIAVSNGIQTISLNPTEIGIIIDSHETSQKALQIGRTGTTTYRLVEMAAGLFSKHQVNPVYSLDLDMATKGIEALTPALSQMPVNASIREVGGTLATVPSKMGYTINSEESLEYLQNNFDQVLKTGELLVVLKPLPPEINDAAPFLLEAEDILERPAVIRLYDPVSDEQKLIQIPREVLASWFQLRLRDQTPSVEMNEALVQNYLESISSEFSDGRFIQADQAAASVAKSLANNVQPTITVIQPATRYRIQPGDTLMKIGWKLGIPYWMILDANPGIDSDRLSTGSELTIPSKSELLPLPVIPNKRILISLKQQRLTVKQDGTQLRQFIISTGINRSPTQPGVFQVQSHVKNAYASVWNLYMPDFLGIYEAWPGFMNGIHGLPMLSGGRRMWANSLGQPASYGCIILGLKEAEWLYEWAEDGVVVEIIE